MKQLLQGPGEEVPEKEFSLTVDTTKKNLSTRDFEDKRLLPLIRSSFAESGMAYGSPASVKTCGRWVRPAERSG